MVAAIAATFGAHPFASLLGECFERLRRDARTEPFYGVLGSLCVSAGLVADRLELGNSVLQHRVGEIGDAVLDRVVEPLEFGVCFARSLAQFGDMRRSALGALLAAAHGTAATTITSTSIPGRQKSVLRQARAGGFAGSTHSFQTEL